MPSDRPKPSGFPSGIWPVFERLRYDVLWLNSKLLLFRDGFLTDDNRRVLFSHTGDAFGLIEDSIKIDITLSIARLIDPAEQGKGAKKKENLTLPYLFELIQQQGNAPALHEGVLARYEALNPILEPIATLRNKVMAHSDRPTAMDGHIDLPLTAADVVTVVNGFKGILNDVEGHFDDSGMLYDFRVSYQDIHSVVRHIRRGIQGFDEDMRRMTEHYMTPSPPQRGEVQ